MNKPDQAFQITVFALMVVWFFLLSATFFINAPIALLGLLPDILILGVIILASYSTGSYLLELLHIDEVKPTEDFVLSTAIGLGGLAALTMFVAKIGFLTWWTISLGLILAVLAGTSRLLGLITQPSYLFGPEELREEGPTPLSWLQYIVIALWVVALFHFCLLPPVTPDSLAGSLGIPSQWLITDGIDGGESTVISLTTGLYAMGLALRGPHLAMMVSALVGGLTLGMLYSGAKRYCGPEAARSTFLVAASLPVFSYNLLNPGDGMLLALFQFCSFYCMMRWFDERRRRWAVTSGILLGLSMSVSTLSFFFVVPLIVAALWWAARKKNISRFGQHLLLGAGATGLATLPWVGFHIWQFGTAVEMFEPLTHLRFAPLQNWFEELYRMPLSLSYPTGEYAPWRLVGPVFLVFIPFYFLTIRKNPMTGLATGIGLATLVLGRPANVPLEYRLVALMLLSLPTAMAAHRLVEKGVMRIGAQTMLYILLAGHIFFATATVEELFNAPHRYLLGLENDDQYLSRTVDYYSAAQAINMTLPVDARMLTIGQEGMLYIQRRMDRAEEVFASRARRWFSKSEDLQRTKARLLNNGYTHLLINTSGSETVLSLQEKLDLADRLRTGRILTSGTVSVFALY